IGSGLEGNLRHGENCFIYPIGDPAAAVECIAEAQDVGTRSRLTSAGMAFVREKMTHDRSIKYWSHCFADIISQPIQVPCIEETRYEPAGRLDRLLGAQLGETVRHVLHRKWVPAGPGDEWPHISVESQIAEETFWDLARTADLGG